MKFYQFFLLLMLVLPAVKLTAQKPAYVEISTAYGSCIVKLYDQTPLHRDNFLKLIKAKYFNSTTFNRIIKNFVVQGGDTDSAYAKGNELNPSMSWLVPEFNDSLFHKKGVIAMGRDDNPGKKSFSTQFYFVQGKTWTDAELDQIQIKYFNGRIIPEYQRTIYRTIGGLPFLDQNYTVFGEIIKGEELIETLSAVLTDKEGTPSTPIRMTIKIKKAR